MNLKIFLIPILTFLALVQLKSRTWNVGPTRTYLLPSQVSSLVSNGDTVAIDAGVYMQDVCFWKAHHLLIVGKGGRAHLKSGGRAAGSKAIWVIQGDSVVVENIEFSECKVPDRNGAGIRLEGTHLVVRNCYFHDNEDGILAGDNAGSDVLIEYSEFSKNGFGDGLSHNLYINHVRSLTFRYNYSHDAVVGHLLKSRAHNNYILFNRLSEEKGDGSYEIDLPNGGYSVVKGNIIQQGVSSQNSAIISYGKEGLSNPTLHELYLSHNTKKKKKANGTFVQMQDGTALFFSLNNIYAGGGNTASGKPVQSTENGSIRNTSIDFFKFIDKTTLDYRLSVGSPCLNKGSLELLRYPQLAPDQQYLHLALTADRRMEFLPDVGALERNFLHPFVQPLQGSVVRDFIIVNYTDWSVAGIQDAFCGDKTYDGHQGTDFVISGFEQMQAGVSVLAADSGVVTAVKDGLFDMETTFDTSKHLGNYICVRHPGNYYTYYGHLQKSSILVKPRDAVAPGQKMASIGCSGNCTDPHLHFELWYDSIQLVDPFAGSCGNPYTFWKDQLPYDTSYRIWKSGVIPGQTGLNDLRFHQYSQSVINADSNYFISYWNLEYGLHQGDLSTVQWFDQAGNRVWQYDYKHPEDAWYYYYWSNVDSKTMGICSSCEVKYLLNGKVKDSIRFGVNRSSSGKDQDSEQVKVWYANGQLISSKFIENATLYTTDGSLVFKGQINSVEILPVLKPGIYMLRTQEEHGVRLIRIFVPE